MLHVAYDVALITDLTHPNQGMEYYELKQVHSYLLSILGAFKLGVEKLNDYLDSLNIIELHILTLEYSLQELMSFFVCIDPPNIKSNNLNWVTHHALMIFLEPFMNV